MIWLRGMGPGVNDSASESFRTRGAGGEGAVRVDPPPPMDWRFGFFLMTLFGVGMSVLVHVLYGMVLRRRWPATRLLENRVELRETPGLGRKGRIWKDWEEKASTKRKCIEPNKDMDPRESPSFVTPTPCPLKRAPPA